MSSRREGRAHSRPPPARPARRPTSSKRRAAAPRLPPLRAPEPARAPSAGRAPRARARPPRPTGAHRGPPPVRGRGRGWANTCPAGRGTHPSRSGQRAWVTVCAPLGARTVSWARRPPRRALPEPRRLRTARQRHLLPVPAEGQTVAGRGPLPGPLASRTPSILALQAGRKRGGGQGGWDLHLQRSPGPRPPAALLLRSCTWPICGLHVLRAPWPHRAAAAAVLGQSEAPAVPQLP